MPVRTHWGQWLEQALKTQGLKPTGLAKRAGLSRSAVSQVMNGKLPLTQKLRSEIAAALHVAIDDVPLPNSLPPEMTNGDGNGAGTLGSPTYFLRGDLPEKTTLEFTDYGIPDHLLPRLAKELRFFDPFNIELDVKPGKQADYPAAQRSVLRHDEEHRRLASGPENAFSKGPFAEVTFVARPNRYQGYALVSRAQTKLVPLSALSARDDKLAAFVNIFQRILDRHAEDCGAFLAEPEQDFYRELWSLYRDIGGPAGPVDGQLADRTLGAIFGKRLGSEARQEAELPRVDILSMLDEIGVMRADFIVGPANVVEVARSGSEQYMVLIEYADVESLLDSVRLSRTRLDAVQRAHEHQEQDAYHKFVRCHREKLDGLKQNNVWAINLPWPKKGDKRSEADERRALCCRLASVAYRTIQYLTDERHADDGFSRILDMLKNHEDARKAFEKVKLGTFKANWIRSFEFTQHPENRPEADSDRSATHVENIHASLAEVWSEIERKKADYKSWSESLRGKDLDDKALEYLSIAENHARIFNFWDAAGYARKARDAQSAKG